MHLPVNNHRSSGSTRKGGMFVVPLLRSGKSLQPCDPNGQRQTLIAVDDNDMEFEEAFGIDDDTANSTGPTAARLRGDQN